MLTILNTTLSPGDAVTHKDGRTLYADCIHPTWVTVRDTDGNDYQVWHKQDIYFGPSRLTYHLINGVKSILP